jgi:hypothetical protein
MKIKDKWKVFAMRQCFSNGMTDDECVEHFNALWAMESSCLTMDYMMTLGLVQWAPFEFRDPGDFITHLESMAETAQHVEGDQL